MNDHELAGLLADRAGQALLEMRAQELDDGANPWDLRYRGDMLGHRILVDGLAEQPRSVSSR